MKISKIVILFFSLFIVIGCKEQVKEKPTVSKSEIKVKKLAFQLPISSESILKEIPLVSNENIENISEYTCGEGEFEYYPIKNNIDFDICIINNNCYDFEYKDLVVIKDSRIISKLLIDEYSWDIEKMEVENIKEETIVSFKIDTKLNIIVTTKKPYNNQVKSIKYKISETGIIEEM